MVSGGFDTLRYSTTVISTGSMTVCTELIGQPHSVEFFMEKSEENARNSISFLQVLEKSKEFEFLFEKYVVMP